MFPVRRREKLLTTGLTGMVVMLPLIMIMLMETVAMLVLLAAAAVVDDDNAFGIVFSFQACRDVQSNNLVAGRNYNYTDTRFLLFLYTPTIWMIGECD